MKIGKKTSCGLNSAMEHMSVHGTVSESDLLSIVGDILETGSETQTKSWHTASLSSAASNVSSVHSYDSSVAERSGSTGTTITSPSPVRLSSMVSVRFMIPSANINVTSRDPWAMLCMS